MHQSLKAVVGGVYANDSSQYGACGMKYGRRGQTWWTDAESHESAAKLFERRMPDGLRRVESRFVFRVALFSRVDWSKSFVMQ